MQAIGIIPARLESSRLPRKLLLEETGRPLIQYVWEAACRAETLDQVVVASDSAEIARRVREFGGRCELTGEHPSGTDRIAEVVLRCFPAADIAVNIQGDEPEIDPAHIDRLVRLLAEHPPARMATLATPITTVQERDDPACTKVVRGEDGRALYFSRAAIPFIRDRNPDELLAEDSPWLLHIGIYAYRVEFLQELMQRSPSPLEQLEKLEQLRALEAGARIQVGIVEQRSVGIDTPEDYDQFVRRQRRLDSGQRRVESRTPRPARASGRKI